MDAASPIAKTIANSRASSQELLKRFPERPTESFGEQL